MKSSLIISMLMVAVFLMASCGNTNKQETKVEAETKDSVIVKDEVVLTTEQYKVAEIKIGIVEQRNLSSLVKVNGVLDVPPQNAVSVSAPMGGYLRSSGLLPGQAVHKGQVLAVIENPEFVDMQQEYLESKSRMIFLEQELKRQQELRKEDVNAAKTLQQVSSEYNMMVAKMAGLRQKLALIGINANSLTPGKIARTANLYSPINGFVTASNVNRGKYVAPTDVLFELSNKSDMHLVLNVFEKDVRQLRVGLPIRFALANETEYNRQATVYLIGKATSADGTIPVHCHLPSSTDPSLLPGMYVKALIETRTDNVNALPIEAVVESDGKNYIFVQKDTAQGTVNFKMIPVVKGTEEGGYVAVTFPEGFDASAARIVVKGAYAVLSAMKNVEE
ncbi:MAG: efflux RND transporter periplasmic adaptor subunit [Sphingobacteriales bacterium]|nr:efflux RND transporter periplasmic adaptor subunit [Sphingobacteriales bacterium]